MERDEHVANKVRAIRERGGYRIHSLDAPPEGCYPFTFVIRFNQISRNGKLLRRNKHEARYTIFTRCIVFDLSHRPRLPKGTATVPLSNNAHEDVARTDLFRAEFGGFARRSGEILHSDTVIAIESFDGFVNSLPVLL
jgi:hypothetical protein